jgi:Fic family protein
MPTKFTPNYSISVNTASCLLRIESAKEKVHYLPMTPAVLALLRETARLYTTHYSTMIEGNRLEADQIEQIVRLGGHFPGREREENEIKGYYAALQQIEQWAIRKVPITEHLIQTIHALVMGKGKIKVRPTPYRDGQNIIRDNRTKTIVYMPPEAKDVPELMKTMVDWISKNPHIPSPIVAAIIHYQFATIHPYYDGNGRTARLLTTLILHLGGYDLKGLYSLEEYYATNLSAYYAAISIGPSHNYYLGRAEADITKWMEYFIEGMAVSFERVLEQMHAAQRGGEKDKTDLLRKLDPKQRRALELFSMFDTVTAHQIGELFGCKPRTRAQLCKNWVEIGFLDIVNFSNKARSYRIAEKYATLLSN